MAEPDLSPAGRLLAALMRPSRLICVICQMLLGLGLAIALILKVYMAVLTDHQCMGDGDTLGNVIRCTPTLSLVAYVLALSAGFDLAYRLFGEGLDRAAPSLVLGLSAVLVSVLGGIQSGGGGWREAILLLSLVLALGGIAFLHEYLKARRNE